MISLLKVYRVNGLSGRTGALSSVYPLVDCRASARENKWTRLKKTLRIIRHDPPSFSSRNVNNVNFYLQLDRNSANWLPIHHTEYTITVFEIVCSTWRHFSTMSSSREVPFLQPWIRTRTTVSEDVSTAMVAPSLQEVGNQTTFVHARIGDFAEATANVGFIPLYKAIHKISKRPPCTLPPPPWNTSRISRSRLWSISH